MNKPRPFVGLKKRLGINSPGITIAVVALVLSLTGGAFAAAGLTTSEKKQVKSIAKAEAKKYAGKPGAPGAAGPAGAKGDKGDQGQPGSAGSEGPEGEEGPEGPEGPEGEGVALTPILKEDPGTCEEQGEEGGVEVRLKKQLAGQGSEVCNGKTGEKGEKGEPWTPNSKLPPGAVESGTWSLTGNTADTSGVRVPLSFFIKLETNSTGVQLDFEHVHFQDNETEEEFKASCEKGAGNPTPLPGHLCVYVNPSDPVTGTVFKGILLPSFSIVEDLPEIEEGAGRAGAILYFAKPTGVATGSGTYAVRAPLAP